MKVVFSSGDNIVDKVEHSTSVFGTDDVSPNSV